MDWFFSSVDNEVNFINIYVNSLIRGHNSSYSVYVYITEVRKVTIISDSIAKYVSGIEGCTGNTMYKLTNRIQTKDADLNKSDCWNKRRG